MGDPETVATPSGTRTSRFAAYILLGTFFALLLYFAAAYAVHHDGFRSPMIYDSKGMIQNNAHLFARHEPLDVIAIIPARPLFMLTLYANYVWKGMDPYSFRVVNAAISAAAGLALAVLAFVVFRMPRLNIPGTAFHKGLVSFFLGLLFVVHPLQTFTVLYIIQREAIMACFFYFAALAAYLAARCSGGGRAWGLFALCGILFLAGMLSKENLITLPMVLLLAEATLFRASFRQILSRGAIFAAITVAVLLVSQVITYNLHGAQTLHAQAILDRLRQHYHEAGLNPVQVVLTQCRVFFLYVVMVLAPFAVQMLLVKAVTVSSSLLDPPETLAAVAGMVVWIGLGCALIRRMPVIAFGLLFSVIVLLPESLLIPQFLFFGYRPLLPMAGILLIVGQVALEVMSRLKASDTRVVPTAAAIAFLAAAVVLAAVTRNQAANWEPLRVWMQIYDDVPSPPENVEKKIYPDILTNFGAELVNIGHQGEAIPILRLAVDLAPHSVSAHNNLGNALLGMGMTAEAIEVYRKAIQMKPDSPELHNNLGAALLASNRHPEAREHFAKAVELHPGFAKAQSNLGIVELQMGHGSEAIEHLSRAVELNPRLALAESKLGSAWELSGDSSRAAVHYENALRLSPHLVESHFGLARTLARLNDTPRAVEHYRRGLELNPHDYSAHNELGKLFLSLSNFSGAEDHFRKALELRPDFTEAKTNLETARERSRPAPARSND
ncbi:MAG: tetratricopeptide repeat protein [Desulfomonile tiedjei]|nr:tetratricopeptide repeat protein [Desulfomonile tiedjei]